MLKNRVIFIQAREKDFEFLSRYQAKLLCDPKKDLQIQLVKNFLLNKTIIAIPTLIEESAKLKTYSKNV